MRFSFLYRTTDGKTWGDFIDASGWRTALDAVQELQGHQCGAVCEIVDHDSGISEFSSKPPDCPKHLRDHPAGRINL